MFGIDEPPPIFGVNSYVGGVLPVLGFGESSGTINVPFELNGRYGLSATAEFNPAQAATAVTSPNEARRIGRCLNDGETKRPAVDTA